MEAEQAPQVVPGPLLGVLGEAAAFQNGPGLAILELHPQQGGLAADPERQGEAVAVHLDREALRVPPQVPQDPGDGVAGRERDSESACWGHGGMMISGL